MSEVSTDNELLEKLKERRLERMRLGQKSFELANLLSDPEFRIALVPLLEREYDECLRSVALLETPDNVAGAGLRDRHEQREILARAIRSPEDSQKRLFKNVNEMMDYLEIEDITHLYDLYLEMTLKFSPHVAQLSEEEIEYLKEIWQTVPWSDLSGKQLYALNRFISTLSLGQLLDNLPGFLSTTS